MNKQVFDLLTQTVYEFRDSYEAWSKDERLDKLVFMSKAIDIMMIEELKK